MSVIFVFYITIVKLVLTKTKNHVETDFRIHNDC